VWLVAAQYSDRNVPILNESAPMQAAAEWAQTAAGSAGNFGSFGFGPMPRRITEKAEGLAHLRFGFVVRAEVVRRAILPIGLIVTSSQVEP
jgi:hypothetical protein